MHLVKIDDELLADASEIRRAEWQTLMSLFLESQNEQAPVQDAHCLHLRLCDETICLSLQTESGQSLSDHAISRASISELTYEYINIVSQLMQVEEQWNSHRLQALDMAKKSVHDAAARELQERCPQLGLSQKSARYLFSLMVSLLIDTTKLLGVHSHPSFR
ncbi:MAG: UPF0262 family protein [Myxococcales bacterium]|nr:MAG: UPF0262 family protein [Myxococcales bacterium]